MRFLVYYLYLNVYMPMTIIVYIYMYIDFIYIVTGYFYCPLIKAFSHNSALELGLLFTPKPHMVTMEPPVRTCQ